MSDKGTALADLQAAAAQMIKAESTQENAAIVARQAGASWEEIGKILGITKQRAHQRYSQLSRESRAERYSEAENQLAADDGKQPVTPSIFLEPKAPAKRKTSREVAREAEMTKIRAEIDTRAAELAASKKVDAQAPAKDLPIYLQPGMVHSLTSDWDKHEQDPSYPAQPGTGKGPHACPRCERTNHHGTQRFTITFFPECTPTRYDPPATVQAMKEWKASK